MNCSLEKIIYFGELHNYYYGHACLDVRTPPWSGGLVQLYTYIVV